MPAHYVKAYVKRGKNDAADAEAICEAVTRPSMRFVPIKTEAQQAVLVMHRSRELLVRQRTQLVNAVRAHLAEFGIIEPQGIWHVGRLRAHLEEEGTVPDPGRKILGLLVEQFEELEKRLAQVEAEILASHRASPVSRRLAKIPGVGPVIATAIVATVPDPSVFRSGREFAAWLGLVPRQRSTGGKQRMGRISRQGDRYIRRLLIVGAHRPCCVRRKSATMSGFRAYSPAVPASRSPSRSPTRPRASPGRSWSEAKPTAGPHLRKPKVRPGTRCLQEELA